MRDTSLHKAQGTVLETLRHTPEARYSDMRRRTGMDSDVFKFHIRTLLKLGYIRKLEPGRYVLTPSGKEFANNLDSLARNTQKQPKISLMMVASKKKVKGEEAFLMQQRKRQPYWGFWGFISGPAQWGAPFEVAAEAEFFKQTGLKGSAHILSFVRQRDFSQTEDLLEDKLFVIVKITELHGQLQNTWSYGVNRWLGLEQLKKEPKYFASNFAIIDIINDATPYKSFESHYSTLDY